ncbi:MAG: zf-HC2 domain-containing protein [Thermoguttaceae bacterium]|nr:zf-HC2 domain-containing protein [Thermoguttaceae bacterium]
MKNLPEELFSAYLDGELTAEEQAQIERLLATSAEARQLLEELRFVSQSLQQLPMHKMTEDLTAKVLQEVQRRKAQQVAEPTSPPVSVSAPGSVSVPAVSVEPDGVLPQQTLPLPQTLSLPPLTEPAESTVSQRAFASTGQPTGGAKPSQDALVAEQPIQSSWRWAVLGRRLITARGLIWSAVAVLVAGLIWWFGPPATRQKELAQAPRHPPSLVAPTDERESIPDHEQKAIGNGGQRTEVQLSQTTGGTGVGIGPSPPEQLHLPTEKAGSELARSPHFGAASSAASWDRACADLESGRLLAGEQPAPGPKIGALNVSPRSVGLAEVDKGAEAAKTLASSGRGFGGAPSTAAKEKMQSNARKLLPEDWDARTGKSSPQALQMPPAQTPTAKPLPTPQEPLQAKKPAETPPNASLPLAAAIAKKEFGPDETDKLSPKQDQPLPPVLADTTLVVVCDVTGAALRQQRFEQILSSQQIVLAEGEEFLEELQPDAGFQKPGAAEAGAAEPPKPAETHGGAKSMPAPGGRPSERVGSGVQPPTGQPQQPSSEIAKSPVVVDGAPSKSAITSSDTPGLVPGRVCPLRSEDQLQFVLVEATPEQVEATLRAIQARRDEFLAISVSPAPADPHQQIYQQYNRVYRAAEAQVNQAPPTELTPPMRESLRPDQGPSLRRSTKAAQLPADANALAGPAGRASEPAVQPPAAESAKQTLLPAESQTAAGRLGGPPTWPTWAKDALEPKRHRQQATQGSQQQAWARRLRLPKHLSQQFAFSQQRLLGPQSGGELLDTYSPSTTLPPGQNPSLPADPQKAMSTLLPAAPPAGRAQLAPPAPAPPLPSHESKPDQPQQGQAETPLPATAPLATPESAKPNVPAVQPQRQEGQKLEAQRSQALPSQTEASTGPIGTSVFGGLHPAQRIRVLFVLRPAEAAP